MPRERPPTLVPPPRLPIDEHVLTEARAEDAASRLTALEEQQRFDHAFLGQVIEAIRMLGHGIETVATQQRIIEEDVRNFSAVDLQMKRDIGAITGKVQDQLIHAATITATAVDTKLA